jgi:hypothetical protein
MDRFEVTIEQFNQFCGKNAVTAVEDCVKPPIDKPINHSIRNPQENEDWNPVKQNGNMRLAGLSIQFFHGEIALT